MIQRKIEERIMDNSKSAEEYDKGLKNTSVLGVYIYLADIIESLFFNEKKILDIGAGTVLLDIELAMRIPEVEFHCLELSDIMIKLAKQNISYYDRITNYKFKLNKRIKLIKKDISKIEDKYDFILSIFLLHHMESDYEAINLLNKIKELMGGNSGIMLVDFIQPRNLFEKKIIRKILTLEFNKTFKEDFNNSLNAAFSIEEIKRILIKSGLKGMNLFLSKPLRFSFLSFNHNPKIKKSSKTILYQNSNLRQKTRYHLMRILSLFSGVRI